MTRRVIFYLFNFYCGRLPSAARSAKSRGRLPGTESSRAGQHHTVDLKAAEVGLRWICLLPSEQARPGEERLRPEHIYQNVFLDR